MEDILREIDAALERRGISARAASIRARGAPEMIRDMRRGHVPSVERLRSLCEVLGLEFYVGPPRWRRAEDGGALLDVPLRSLEQAAQNLVRLTVDAGGNPFPDDLLHAYGGENATRDATKPTVDALGNRTTIGMASQHASAIPNANEGLFARDVEFEVFRNPLGLVVCRTIGDDGSNHPVWSESFREWLEMRGIDPDTYTFAMIEKDSTEPTPPEESETISGGEKTDPSPLSKKVATLKPDTPSGPIITDAD